MVTDNSAGASEGVGGMVNEPGLTSGSITRLEVCEGGRSVGQRPISTMSLAEVGGVFGW